MTLTTSLRQDYNTLMIENMIHVMQKRQDDVYQKSALRHIPASRGRPRRAFALVELGGVEPPSRIQACFAAVVCSDRSSTPTSPVIIHSRPSRWIQR